jgi:hypothetical protein
MNPMASTRPKDYRGWLYEHTNPKVEISNLNYLISIRDSAESGLGFNDNRHLNYFIESINMNVGGLYRDVKVSSPPRTGISVGAVIVVGGRESLPQGEGRQRVGSCRLTSSNSAVNVPCERKCRLQKRCSDNFRGNPEGGMSTLGEPDALKGASPVRRRG